MSNGKIRFPGLAGIPADAIHVELHTGPLPEDGRNGAHDPSWSEGGTQSTWENWADYGEPVEVVTRWADIPVRDGSMVIGVSEHGDVTVTGIARADR